jgi:biopolymer transport protein ExbB
LADSPLFALVAEEGGGEVSYFTILIDSVTVDGWIVIALLGVMAVISVWVMVTKTMMLREAERANGKFLALFADQSMDLLTPGHPAAQAIKADPQSLRSSIYRLYAIGLHEIEKRFEHQRQAGRPTALRGAGLESIRASLDAAMLRENQKFNSGMVLLTIAISGGPFLGLLGTVVGVMITFAAIAAAGEVNVNSIAPGIAAALVATVAGLGVAIPALFGYNWLAAKIKNVSGDTQVFVDEFVTKTAELHAD